MLSATSYQIVLLSGTSGQADIQLYILGSVFFGASIVWYLLFRFKPAVWVLSLPWFFFGVALLIGLPYVSKSLLPAHDILSSIATWAYGIASAAGFAFFGLNFGEEAGAATEVWILRACIVQGSQQVWVAALWFWGYNLGQADMATPWWIVCIVWPLSVMSFLFTVLLWRGLPGKPPIRESVWDFIIRLTSNVEYYRQTPPKVPNFYIQHSFPS
jgi:alpha-1,3-glucan synthase